MTEPASQQLPRDYLVVLTSLLPRVIRSAWVGGVVFAVGLAATATWAPCWANVSAAARPMPEPAPVINTVLLVKGILFSPL